MKTFKFLMPFLLVAFALVGCDTDDLRNDIDELKNRVESLEALVSTMNDNVNALKVFAEGGVTISSYEKVGDTYKLVLSDGRTIELTQGKQGDVDVPTININENNEWVVNGNAIEGSVAKGDDAKAPEFNIQKDNDTGKAYWYVDYKDGKGPVQVKDLEGNPVEATTSGEVNIKPDFFEEVKVENGCMVVTLTTEPKGPYSLPIVEGLICKIETEDVDEYKDNILTVGYGRSVKLQVEVTGDTQILTAPAGWTAELGTLTDGMGELTITAPQAPETTSRAVADNTKDVVLQTNKGVNWAVAKIQVKAEEVIQSYYQVYQDGKNIEIGEGENKIIINKETYPDAQFVENDNTEITADGVFFIKEGIKVSFKKGALKNNILIGNNPKVKTEVTLSAYLPLKGEGKGFAAKNISFTGTSGLNYIAQTTDVIKYEFLCIDDCLYEIPVAKNFVNIKNNAEISNVTIVNSKFKVPVTSWAASRIISVTGSLKSNGVNVKNNVFYASNDGQAINGTLLFASGKDVDYPVIIMNNTYVNFLTNSHALVKGVLKKDVTIENNIFWTNTIDKSYGCALVTPETGSGNIQYNLSKNILFNKNKNNSLSYFTKDNVPSGMENTSISSESSDPFEGSKFVLESGVFVPNTNYADYGAKLD